LRVSEIFLPDPTRKLSRIPRPEPTRAVLIRPDRPDPTRGYTPYRELLWPKTRYLS